MKIIKTETNYKHNLYLHKYNYIRIRNYDEKIENNIINIYPNINYQTFFGFGGAFTESSGFAYSMLPQHKKNSFINDYFGTSGLNYYFGRLPIGSTDFSLDSYSYSYQMSLEDFSIEKDQKYILPLIKSALIENKKLVFLASPWSPPAFMKSNKKLFSGGKLLSKYKQLYVDYLVKYINSY